MTCNAHGRPTGARVHVIEASAARTLGKLQWTALRCRRPDCRGPHQTPWHVANQKRCGDTDARAGRWPGMDRHMTREHWRSLGLKRTTQPEYEAGTLRTIEAAGTAVVGIPKHGTGHQVLGTASSNEEAVVIATMLRLFNPN